LAFPNRVWERGPRFFSDATATSEAAPGFLWHKALGKTGAWENRKKKTMKSRLITMCAACVALFVTVSIGLAQDPAAKNNDRPNRWRQDRGNPVERLTRLLDLTPEQQAKVKAIFEQARPQIQAIRENIRSQIRPILTPAQQQKWDALKKAHEDMRKAKEEMRDALKKQ
jgi:Spy/CpxP family protein refolding chaperone